MKKRNLALLILAVVLTCWGREAEAGEYSLLNFPEHARLPAFTLPDLESGKPVTFTPASGQPALLLFFSLSPSYREQRSRELAETLAKLGRQFPGRVRCLAVYSEPGRREAAKKLLGGRRLALEVLVDEHKEVYESFGVYMMPLAILLSGDGLLQAVVPPGANSEAVLAQHLKFLLGDWTREQWQESLKPVANAVKSKEEKEYGRRVNYGRVMLARQLHAAALREFTTAVKIKPQAGEAYSGLGQVYLAQDKLELAEQSLRQALRILPDSAEAMGGLGVVLYKKGAVAEAIPLLENALAGEEPQPRVILTLAEFYEKEGQREKARRLHKLALDRLLKRFPLPEPR